VKTEEDEAWEELERKQAEGWRKRQIADAQEKNQMTPEDWKNLWEEFDEKLDDLEEEFQSNMVSLHGEGYYHKNPDDYWDSQKKLIQRLVEAKLKEKS
jgi:hypothetical protein